MEHDLDVSMILMRPFQMNFVRSPHSSALYPAIDVRGGTGYTRYLILQIRGPILHSTEDIHQKYLGRRTEQIRNHPSCRARR
jgi:hypothetical protein